ncbi:hypothetical protein [Candidatus Tisiphia endosymbiont of Hybos culiciformis]|uniref:hypothetical protein n=1 Tax=Candidatus Tisiphia endosymbiont of Hybos culiciformis TaxID=3139331 RepID=UPI003CCB30EC
MIPSTIELTGKVYIKYIDSITKLNVGDIKLLLNDDALSVNKGDYENLKSSGYIKAKIFDGLVWQNISISELCTEKEYKFTKRQKAIDSALLCKTIIEDRQGVMLYRTYRGHFTTQE